MSFVVNEYLTFFFKFQSDFPKDSDMIESFHCTSTQVNRQVNYHEYLFTIILKSSQPDQKALPLQKKKNRIWCLVIGSGEMSKVGNFSASFDYSNIITISN